MEIGPTIIPPPEISQFFKYQIIFTLPYRIKKFLKKRLQSSQSISRISWRLLLIIAFWPGPSPQSQYYIYDWHCCDNHSVTEHLDQDRNYWHSGSSQWWDSCPTHGGISQQLLNMGAGLTGLDFCKVFRDHTQIKNSAKVRICWLEEWGGSYPNVTKLSQNC